MAMTRTPKFRVSYPNVFKSKLNDLNGKQEYSVVALFPKGADLSVLKKAAEEAITKKWGADRKKWPANLRTPFRDQGERAKIDEVTGKEVLPAGYEKGAIFINLKSSVKPGLVDQAVNPITDEVQFYAGCFAYATVNAYAYDQKGNRGVSFGLGNLQKASDGDSLGTRTKPEDDFAPIDGVAESQGANATSLFD